MIARARHVRVLVALCALQPACRRPASPAPVPDAARAGDPAPSLYPDSHDAPDPLTMKLCDALHVLPEARRAACCSAAPATTRSNDCLHLLGAAVRAGAVTLDASEIEACVAALQTALEGCDWVGPSAPPLPEACAAVIHGALADKTPCRSSLECRAPLHCDGVSATSPGVCGPPRENGAGCDRATDALAVLTLKDHPGGGHPECAGHCERGTCTSPLSPGGRCTTSLQCDAEHHCAKGRCQSGGFAKAGEECTGSACEPGTRCIKGRCLVPGAAGASCDSDLECRGACVARDARDARDARALRDGGARGVCARACERR